MYLYGYSRIICGYWYYWLLALLSLAEDLKTLLVVKWFRSTCTRWSNGTLFGQFLTNLLNGGRCLDLVSIVGQTRWSIFDQPNSYSERGTIVDELSRDMYLGLSLEARRNKG